MPTFFALLAGAVFGIGLIVSGMADPAKVLGFLDLGGAWDPSLAFVIGGAILVGAFAFTFARKRNFDKQYLFSVVNLISLKHFCNLMLTP